jgi:hypothetical protein
MIKLASPLCNFAEKCYLFLCDYGCVLYDISKTKGTKQRKTPFERGKKVIIVSCSNVSIPLLSYYKYTNKINKINREFHQVLQ